MKTKKIRYCGLDDACAAQQYRCCHDCWMGKDYDCSKKCLNSPGRNFGQCGVVLDELPAKLSTAKIK